jgi:L-alanine-DL-glutamate epimerase-like enolase superfamily enzyme
MRISSIELHHLRIALPRQRVSLIEPTRADAFDSIAVEVISDAGVTGLGFTHAASGSVAVRALIEKDVAPLIIGEDPLRPNQLFSRIQARFRNVGFPGLVSRAYAAIDIALWDLKAKAANLPLYQLLGGSRSSASVYLSDLAAVGQEPGQTLAAAKPLVEAGALGVVVEVGGGDVQIDADRVQQIRDGLGEDAWLGIDVQGRYDLGTALAMAHFYEEDVGIDRYESPLPANDAMGYRRLAERMEVPLALGSTFDDRDDFRRVLETGNVRVLRPDVVRLGGITPFLKVAALAEAYPVTITPYGLPEIGVQLACGLPNVDAVDYVGWLAPLFVEPLRIEKGKLTPSMRPGHGLELNPEALEKFRVAGSA